MPVPLRIFINKIRGFGSSLPLILVLWLLVAVMPLVAVLMGDAQLAELILLPLAITVYILVPLSAPWLYARRLLKAGYGVEDARLALKADVDRRLEEIRFEFGKGLTWVDRVLRLLSRGGLTVLAGAIVAGLFGVPLDTVAGPGMVAGNVGMWSFFAGAFRNKRRRDAIGEGALSVLQSRVGDWLFSLGGLGLERGALSSAGAHRPTEMAIGLAADRLFEELPKPLRRELHALPEVVRRLEGDAKQMRRQIDELNGVLAEIGDDSDGVGANDRGKLRGDVEATRDEAQCRMTEAVSALETIRMGLLRLHAGDGTVEGLTVDLGAARDVSADIEGLLQGKEEVERLLAERQTGGQSAD